MSPRPRPFPPRASRPRRRDANCRAPSPRAPSAASLQPAKTGPQMSSPTRASCGRREPQLARPRANARSSGAAYSARNAPTPRALHSVAARRPRSMRSRKGPRKRRKRAATGSRRNSESTGHGPRDASGEGMRRDALASQRSRCHAYSPERKQTSAATNAQVTECMQEASFQVVVDECKRHV